MPSQVIKRTPIFSGKVLQIEQHELLLENGQPYTLDLVQHPGAAAVVALDDQGQVLMVRQLRHAAGEHLLEVPAGLRDGGEAALSCAKRELEEETGVVAQSWQPLGDIWTSPGFCTERICLFLAQDLRATQQHLDADEELEVVRVPLAQALAQALSGALRDAKTVVALLRAQAALRDKSAR